MKEPQNPRVILVAQLVLMGHLGYHFFLSSGAKWWGLIANSGMRGAKPCPPLCAGYETTANTLAFTTYCLATNPDKAAKLMQVCAKSQDANLLRLNANGIAQMRCLVL